MASERFCEPSVSYGDLCAGRESVRKYPGRHIGGKMIGNRPLEARRLRDKAEARHCQVVFVSSSESARLAEIIESLRGANVLLVGESNGFAASGGTIQFTIGDSRVRFTINIDAVNRANLMFSSKLLSLAKIVHDQGHS